MGGLPSRCRLVASPGAATSETTEMAEDAQPKEMAEDAQPKEMAEDAEPKPAKRGKRSAFAPIDLVEDRMRGNLVSVAIMFCMYLVIGSFYRTFIELVGKVSFSSQLPSIMTSGPT